MKRSITTILFLFISLCSFGQMSYYLTVNGMLQINHFNAERDPFLGYSFIDGNPRMEFKVERNRIGLSAHFTFGLVTYHEMGIGEIEPGAITGINHHQIGLNIHYKLLDHKHITVNPFAGAHYGWFYSTIFEYWFQTRPWGEPITDVKEAKTTGIQTGINIMAPIWKGLYASSNVRYSVYPFTEHQLFRNNLIWEAGIGYKFQRKKRIDADTDKRR